MPLLTEPASLPEWADGASAIVEPSGAKKALGWIVEKPPHQFFNWWMNVVFLWIAFVQQKLNLSVGYKADTTLVLAADQITPTQGNHQVDTQAAAATDDLETIVTTNFVEGSHLLLRSVNAARVVVVKHAVGGAGQIFLKNSRDFWLSNPNRILVLKRIGTDWYEVSRATPDHVSAVKTVGTYNVIEDDDLLLCDPTGGLVTIALPAAASMADHEFVVKRTTASVNKVTITAASIDGATSINLSDQYEFVRIRASGGAYYTV